MRYRRALFLVDPGKPVGPAISVLRRVAPRLERLLVVAPLPAPIFAWLSGDRASGRDEEASVSLETLREATAGAAASVDVQLVPELGSEALALLCAAQEIDLIVFGSRSLRSASVVAVQGKRPPVAVLWAEGKPAPGPIKDIGCVALDDRSRGAIAAFLRDHADRSMHVALLSPTAIAPDLLAAALQVSGVEATVEISSPRDAPSLRQWLDEWTERRPIDLLVFARVPSALLLGALWTRPVLLLPPLPAPRPFAQRAIDVPDLVDDGGPLRARVGHAAAVGNLASVPDQALAFVSGGHVVATVTTRAGEAELPAGLDVASLGVYRIGEGASLDPLAAVEERVAVVRRGERPLVIFDSELSRVRLQSLARTHGRSGSELLAVRLRPTRSCQSIRQRLRALGLSPRVVDARAILDEGEAFDVSESLDAVRLARVASRLLKAGFPMAAIVHQGHVQPLVEGFAALAGDDLARDSGGMPQAFSAAPFEGNRIELELDNATARGWLLDAINGSTKTLNLQVYMAMDDDVGGPVEAALAAAGARGVTVRVLIDSLHGLHGSLGVTNPLLARLSARPGVELRTLRPITELPSLMELKQRDHRKLVIADGRIALLGGRNLSHEYYTAFAEVELTPESMWREVPWLDAGARVEGPAVAALSSSFIDAWTEAGGAAFEIASPAPAGVSAARVVVHRGLRDARTLEAYLELIETAQSHVYAVNGFPLVLELQHALLRALGRGIRVRALIGHLTPTYGGRPFSGPWASARTAATELVHSRMDPVIAAGGEVYLFARHHISGWAPDLGVVHPHVHAKAMSADGVRCAVGSANMDITSSYWESELLLVVEEPARARAFEAQIDTLIAGSIQVRKDDPAWQQLAKRRAWMRHWPGVLSV